MTLIDVKTEITGNVWKIEANEGDTVTEGQVLVILESMKMEIPILSPEDGALKELRIKEGDVTTEGDVVAVIEA
ncbi:MAG: biotin/lipoyl-binding carrier protein [Halomonadaceae bacterium]|nr:biotin/lipoyl-binding carrier protein [Halomonadaceae bacterium]